MHRDDFAADRRASADANPDHCFKVQWLALLCRRKARKQRPDAGWPAQQDSCPPGSVRRSCPRPQSLRSTRKLLPQPLDLDTDPIIQLWVEMESQAENLRGNSLLFQRDISMLRRLRGSRYTTGPGCQITRESCGNSLRSAPRTASASVARGSSPAQRYSTRCRHTSRTHRRPASI